jgi:uncharacterized protein YidB (DUF937 family)
LNSFDVPLALFASPSKSLQTENLEAITPNSLEDALGSDTIDAVSKQTGMGRGELLAALSKHLPGFIDQLTPEGRLPTEAEASRMV